MFKRILIANRGEIAMRVIRACRELGIRTVAMYAECDATAIFVKKADEAHLVGPGPVQGFLDMQAIVDLAKRSGADGIHPGYGFRHDQELLSKMEVARREALSSFGNGEIFLEKYIERPHHIEFQILADKHGNIIHLGERDCSIQRRHQKLIEIAPSLVLDKELRARMGEAAIAVSKAVHYDNAGTVEFLLDPNRNFYFIEMNTRIQVEHTVTEQITAIDLVRSQIEIAAGLPLEFSQEDVTLQGHAIQCRINAEDPRNNFRPCTGTVTAYFSPGGIGVRIDGMAYKDYTIPPYYDALLAKLVVRGRTWEETVSRAHRSLEEFV